jgi:UDP-N-acetylglucosamine 2-epimerase (non-hydrolysing)
MKLLAIVGARPNFMKIAPVLRAAAAADIPARLCHTGQHYDARMSEVFFEELRLPRPDLYLKIGSGSHAEQTAKIMIAFEQTLLEEKPGLVLVVGDVNSTVACSLVCAKLGVPVAHVEAGLRSFDRGMPEEINRMVTDILADLLFTTSPEAEGNLLREGVDPAKIHFTGNVMIDSLRYYESDIDRSQVLDELDLETGGFALMTLHRPSNVDREEDLRAMLDAVAEAGRRMPVVWPLHPRTRKMIDKFGIDAESLGFRLVDPLGYFDFQRLMREARLVLTDSGGIQEETTVLGVPCLTLRENTERPITCEIGTNRLVGTDPENIVTGIREILEDDIAKEPNIPPLWDGRAAERIVALIQDWALPQ